MILSLLPYNTDTKSDMLMYSITVRLLGAAGAAKDLSAKSQDPAPRGATRQVLGKSLAFSVNARG